jgi:hypothetical protein
VPCVWRNLFRAAVEIILLQILAEFIVCLRGGNVIISMLHDREREEREIRCQKLSQTGMTVQ